MKTYWCHSCKRQFEDLFLEDDEPVWDECNGVFIEEIEPENSEQDHPKNFEPYVAQNNNSSFPNQNSAPFPNNGNMGFSFTPGAGAQAIHIINANMGNGGTNPQGGMVGNLMNMLSNIFNGNGGDLYEGGNTFDQILQQIIANDPNKYGPPPASKEAIKNLPKGKYRDFFPENEESKDENEEKEKEDNKSWGICYDEYSYEDAMELAKLPCHHIYHTEWLLPGLEKHNTCPTCRNELPTDDVDYENNKLNSQDPNYMRDLLRQANDSNRNNGSNTNNNSNNDRGNGPGTSGGSMPSYHF